jgi:hypothetical protein
VGDGQESPQHRHHQQQGKDDHREGHQQDPRDRQHQPHHQHAEGGQHQHLAQQPHEERTGEGVQHGVADHLERLAAEGHQPGAHQHQGQEHAKDAGAVARGAHPGGDGRRDGRSGGRFRRGVEGADLAQDVATEVAHLAGHGEHIAGDHRAGVDDDVALDAGQVAFHPAIDVGVAAHHQQVAGVALRRAEPVVAEVRLPAGHGDAERGVSWRDSSSISARQPTASAPSAATRPIGLPSTSRTPPSTASTRAPPSVKSKVTEAMSVASETT